MQMGTCRLCLTPGVALHESHYMPQGLHKIVQGGGPTATEIKGTVAMLSSRQAKTHLLCADCEKRFSKRGEDWIIDNCWRSPTGFRLLDALERSPTPWTSGGIRVYEARKVPGVDVDRIVYFAASVFWRGAAHAWNDSSEKAPGGGPVNIDFGTHLESLRRFLMDDGPFPHEMYLSTLIEDKRDANDNMHLVPPFMAFDQGYDVFRCFIPGVTFTLWIGENVAGEIKRTCTARAGLLVITSSLLLRETEIRARVRESEKKGKLAEISATKRRMTS
jgi:hypothetical protein